MIFTIPRNPPLSKHNMFIPIKFLIFSGVLKASKPPQKHEPSNFTFPAAITIWDSNPSLTPSKQYLVREPYQLFLEPFVQIGVKSVRPGLRHDPPEGYRVACPNDRMYCIDYQTSDNGTCMHPDPVEVKKCYDSSCVRSPWAPAVRKKQNEDTYCKDFMTPQGRLCQWIDNLPCTCESKSILYYSGEFIAPGEPIPHGFNEVFPCTYPLDLIRRAQEEAAIKAREKKNKSTRRPGKRNRDRKLDPEAGDSDNAQSSSHETQGDKGARTQMESANSSVLESVSVNLLVLAFIGVFMS
jgi:hypothetical protein